MLDEANMPYSTCVRILPSLGFLYVLDQRSLLPEEGVESRPAASGSTPAS